MRTRDEAFRLSGKTAAFRVTPSSLVGKILTFAAGAVLIVAGFVLSLFVVAVGATIALLILGYVWWNTRELRRQLRERPPGGRVIDGEAISDK